MKIGVSDITLFIYLFNIRKKRVKNLFLFYLLFIKYIEYYLYSLGHKAYWLISIARDYNNDIN